MVKHSEVSDAIPTRQIFRRLPSVFASVVNVAFLWYPDRKQIYLARDAHPYTDVQTKEVL